MGQRREKPVCPLLSRNLDRHGVPRSPSSYCLESGMREYLQCRRCPAQCPQLRGPLAGNEWGAVVQAVSVFKRSTSVSLQSLRGAIAKARNTGPSQSANTVVRVV